MGACEVREIISIFFFKNLFFKTFYFVLAYSWLTGEGNGTPLQYSLAWKIPWMEELAGLQSVGSLRVGRD